MEDGTLVLAIDPGTEKCGLAVVTRERVLLREVVARTQVVKRVAQILPQEGPVIIGDRTGSELFSREVVKALPGIAKRISKVDEHLSSVEARSRYWQENRPRGWRRLIPTGLQVPPVPIDDYVAVVLAERYFAQKKP